MLFSQYPSDGSNAALAGGETHGHPHARAAHPEYDGEQPQPSWVTHERLDVTLSGFATHAFLKDTPGGCARAHRTSYPASFESAAPKAQNGRMPWER